jgi:hypothetical protein
MLQITAIQFRNHLSGANQMRLRNFLGTSLVGLILCACGGGGGNNASSSSVGNAVNPVPSIAVLQPAVVTASTTPFTLKISGSGFVAASTVTLNGAALSTSFVSDTQLTAAVSPSSVNAPGTVAVAVNNPSPGGGSSNAATLDVSSTNPVPVIATLSPESINANSGAPLTLTVNGSGFVFNSTVSWNGTALSTNYISDTQLTATVPASGIATAGSISVTVDNPAPGGGTSAAAAFTTLAASTAVPGAPSQLIAYVGGASTTAYVIFAPPANNGGPALTAFTATASPSGISATTHVLTVPGGHGKGLPRRVDLSGLPNSPQTITVTATNANGTGPASAPSNSITPEAYSDFYIACGGSVVGLNPLWSGGYNFNAHYFYVTPGTPSSQGPGTYLAPTNPLNAADGVVEVSPVASPYELQLYVKADHPASVANGQINSTPFSYITFQVWPTQAGQTMNFPAWETTFNFEGVVTAGTNSRTQIADSTQSWAVNQFLVGASGVFNRTQGGEAGYVANSLGSVTSTGLPTTPAVGDHYYVQVGDISVGQTIPDVTVYNITHPGSFLPNQWNTVKIPLSAFNIGLVDNNMLYKMHVGMSNFPNTIYFANIALTNH